MIAQYETARDDSPVHPKIVAEGAYAWEFVKRIHVSVERWLDEEQFVDLFGVHMLICGMLDSECRMLKGEYERRPEYLFAMSLSAETAIEAAKAGLRGPIVLEIANEPLNWREFDSLPPELMQVAENARLDLAKAFPEVIGFNTRQFAHIAVPWLIRNGHFVDVKVEGGREICVASEDDSTIFSIGEVRALYKLARKSFGFDRRKLGIELFSKIVNEVLVSRRLAESSEWSSSSKLGVFMLPWAFVLHTCLAAEAVYLRLRPGVPAEDALNAARDQKAFRDVADLDDEILAFAERMRARFAVFYPTLSYMPPEAFAHLILPWLVRKRYVADCKPG